MYGWLLPGAESFVDWLGRRPSWLRRMAERAGFVRGLLLFVASVRSRRIAVVRAQAGWRTLLLLRALFGRERKLVALHFIVHPGGGRIWRSIDRWAVRRALAVGQVLTEWERDQYAAAYRLPMTRFVHVPWALRRERSQTLPPAPTEPLVLCAGRAFCDWETMFAASAGTGWPLTVVCAKDDLERVRRLNVAGDVEVESDLGAEEFSALLRRATVLVIAMREAGVSQGHVRLMDANDAGVAVVATRTRSLEQYVIEGQTALLVEPGDAGAMRTAVGRLLDDAAERERLRGSAFDHSQSWTGHDYLQATTRLLDT